MKTNQTRTLVLGLCGLVLAILLFLVLQLSPDRSGRSSSQEPGQTARSESSGFSEGLNSPLGSNGIGASSDGLPGQGNRDARVARGPGETEPLIVVRDTEGRPLAQCSGWLRLEDQNASIGLDEEFHTDVTGAAFLNDLNSGQGKVDLFNERTLRAVNLDDGFELIDHRFVEDLGRKMLVLTVEAVGSVEFTIENASEEHDGVLDELRIALWRVEDFAPPKATSPERTVPVSPTGKARLALGTGLYRYAVVGRFAERTPVEQRPHLSVSRGELTREVVVVASARAFRLHVLDSSNDSPISGAAIGAPFSRERGLLPPDETCWTDKDGIAGLMAPSGVQLSVEALGFHPSGFITPAADEEEVTVRLVPAIDRVRLFLEVGSASPLLGAESWTIKAQMDPQARALAVRPDEVDRELGRIRFDGLAPGAWWLSANVAEGEWRRLVLLPYDQGELELDCRSFAYGSVALEMETGGDWGNASRGEVHFEAPRVFSWSAPLLSGESGELESSFIGDPRASFAVMRIGVEGGHSMESSLMISSDSKCMADLAATGTLRIPMKRLELQLRAGGLEDDHPGLLVDRRILVSGILDGCDRISASAVTQRNGSAWVAIPAGTEDLLIAVPGSGGGRSTAPDRSALEPDRPWRITVPVELPAVSGLVEVKATRSGLPVSSLIVVLVPLDADREQAQFQRELIAGQLPTMGITDMDGRLRIGGVAPGHYRLGTRLRFNSGTDALPLLPNESDEIRVESGTRILAELRLGGSQ